MPRKSKLNLPLLESEEDHPEESAVTKTPRKKSRDYLPLFNSTDFTQQEVDRARALLDYERTRDILPNIK